MSMFWCAQCGDLKDSDDGCEEAPNGTGLICDDCAVNVAYDDEDDRYAEEDL